MIFNMLEGHSLPNSPATTEEARSNSHSIFEQVNQYMELQNIPEQHISEPHHMEDGVHQWSAHHSHEGSHDFHMDNEMVDVDHFLQEQGDHPAQPQKQEQYFEEHESSPHLNVDMFQQVQHFTQESHDGAATVHQQFPESTESVRPDMIFSPMLSPSMPPIRSRHSYNSVLDFNYERTRQQTPSTYPAQPPTNMNGAFFSPLTSPALEATTPMENGKRKYNKRKTPATTPMMAPVIPGRIVKQSPVMKPKGRTHSLQKTLKTTPLIASTNSINSGSEFKLPTSSMDSRPNSTEPYEPRSVEESDGSVPATIMNFPAAQQIILPSNSANGTASPVIRPKKEKRKPSIVKVVPKEEPVTDNDDGDDVDKKMTHKLAEQGRRNRMNQAIYNLGNMIPEHLANTVPVPSKATTVELACDYIKELLQEIDQLKKLTPGSDGHLVADSSISPLETV